MLGCDTQRVLHQLRSGSLGGVKTKRGRWRVYTATVERLAERWAEATQRRMARDAERERIASQVTFIPAKQQPGTALRRAKRLAKKGR